VPDCVVNALVCQVPPTVAVKQAADAVSGKARARAAETAMRR
jgi:hypothetical protein